MYETVSLNVSISITSSIISFLDLNVLISKLRIVVKAYRKNMFFLLNFNGHFFLSMHI